MIFEKFSPKQVRSMLWWKLPETNKHDALICDGSVRSGKSLSMTIGFILWSCSEFNSQTFAICGKTAGSILRNVILPMQQWLEGVAKISVKLSRSCFDVTIGGKTNRYYFFGGKDESSYMLIQGMTLAGVMFDEVALMPRSFVEQALARCSILGSRFWFNCNPDSPEHWFYKEWIQKLNEKNAAYLHFTMDDNYSLSPAIKKRYESLYTGVFKERYIDGKWCVTEGIIYDCWKDEYIIDNFIPPDWSEWYISMDYGTVNPCSMGLWCVTDDVAVRVAEYYYDSRSEKHSRTDEEHYAELVKLAETAGIDNIQAVVIDPSAASFIECIRRHGRFNVRKANNDVLSGIRRTSTLIKAGKFRVHKSCKGFLKEVKLYCWDEKAASDSVIKENDHAMDDTRYLVNTVLKNTILRNMGGG
jgi:phage terminase, large subunit, PBSX family